jgi:hypothetical protein
LTKDVTVGEESIRAGMRAALNNRLGLNYGFSSYEFGYLMGSVMFPMLFVALVFLFVLKRKFVWVVVFAVLELIVGLAFSFPFLSIIILVVILTNPTRDYLKRKNKSSPPSAMPIDYDFKDN